MRISLLGVVAVIVAGCGGGTTTVTQTVTAPPAQTETTGTTAKECPDFDFNIKITSVEGMTCEEAAAALEQLGSVKKSFQLAGFQCDRVSGQRLSGIWKCVNGPKSFTFSFAD